LCAGAERADHRAEANALIAAVLPDTGKSIRLGITGVPGVDLVGPIPEELQTKIGFAAGLSASAKERDAAQALIRFLTAPAAGPTLKANGVDPA